MHVRKLLVAAIATAAATATAGAQTTSNTINCGQGETAQLGTVAAPGTCAVTNQVSATVQSVARLSITSATTTLTQPKASEFGDGTASSGTQVNTTGPTLSVSANSNYVLTAKADAGGWMKDGSAYANKQVSDLQIKVNSGSMAAIGTVAPSSPATNLATYALTYGNKYSWTVDVPGTYTLGLTFTLTAP